MSSDRRFEQDLPALLDDLYLGSMPTYRDHILQQTVRTRQRPAWLILERWLPMVDFAGQPVLVRRLPWRTIGLAVLLVALLVAVLAALAVGGRPNLPAPFGPARNGLVAYASGGDIYAVDPVTGLAKAVTTGSDTDLAPVWSRDGTRFVFARQVVAGSEMQLFVAHADGSRLIAITAAGQPQLASYSFSPDGSEIAYTVGADPNSDLCDRQSRRQRRPADQRRHERARAIVSVPRTEPRSSSPPTRATTPGAASTRSTSPRERSGPSSSRPPA